MQKIKNWILGEFWLGYNLFEKLFMLSMVLLQIIVFIITPDTPLNIIAGIAGVVSVILCAKGKISFYFVGFIQTIICIWLTWKERFYGEFAENIFYLITMIWGIFVWKKNLHKNEDGSKQIKAKVFKWWHWIIAIIVSGIATVGLGYGLTLIGSQQAYIDSATNIFAVIAQLLMIWGYREQWVWWLVIDLLCIIMWATVGNWSMVAMYIAWTINCLYGWYNWTKLHKNK